MSSARRQWPPRTDHGDLAPNAHPSPQWCQNRCWDRDRVFFGGFAASVAALSLESWRHAAGRCGPYVTATRDNRPPSATCAEFPAGHLNNGPGLQVDSHVRLGAGRKSDRTVNRELRSLNRLGERIIRYR